MKIPSIALFAPVCLLGAVAQASQLTVSIDAFSDPTTFSITQGANLSLRVAELVPADGTNASTHVLIEGLSPIEQGTQYYASTYSGINVDSGATQDVGVLYLQMPAGSSLPEGTVASPIVGVVQRTGAWSNYSLTTPATSVGGSSGASQYATGTLTMSLLRGAEAFTGTTTYTVVDADSLTIAPFTLTKDGATSYQMSGATMMRDGSRFYGTLTNLSTGAAYDSLLFGIEFTGIPDLDGDGIPDISDDSVVAGLTPGQWNDTELGWVYGYTAEWGYSIFMGYVYMADKPWIYQEPFGWMYYASKSSNAPATGFSFWFYSPTLGWVFANDSFGGFFQSQSTNWAYNNFLNPNP